MERDVTVRKRDCAHWAGEVTPGVFLGNVDYVRNQWLSEGVVPRCNVRGFRSFNSITRATDQGDCTVKEKPMFFEDICDFSEKIGCPYSCEGIGMATLRAIEFLMTPKRAAVPAATKKR